MTNIIGGLLPTQMFWAPIRVVSRRSRVGRRGALGCNVIAVIRERRGLFASVVRVIQPTIHLFTFRA